MTLEFLHFNLYHYQCNDLLEIIDGTQENSNLLKYILCGGQSPTSVVSTVNEIELIFKTDLAVSGTGFKLKVDIADYSLCPSNAFSVCGTHAVCNFMDVKGNANC